MSSLLAQAAMLGQASAWSSTRKSMRRGVVGRRHRRQLERPIDGRCNLFRVGDLGLFLVIGISTTSIANCSTS
ncbi:MAG: hypothetical protein M3306_21905 [Actinomycetota bacterium]|nr:hypothetical protein [Actinomycetota bacterium]